MYVHTVYHSYGKLNYSSQLFLIIELYIIYITLFHVTS